MSEWRYLWDKPNRWDQGEWGWSIVPTDTECAREDPVKPGAGIICRWNIPVMKFTWVTFPIVFESHDVFVSLN